MSRNFVLICVLTASLPSVSAWSYIATSCDRLPPELHAFVKIDTYTRIDLPPSATEKAKFVVKRGQPFEFLYSTRLADANCKVQAWPYIRLGNERGCTLDKGHYSGISQTNNTDEIAFLYTLTDSIDGIGVALVGDMKPARKDWNERCSRQRANYDDESRWESISVQFTNSYSKCTMVIQVLPENARLESEVLQPRSESCYPEEPGIVYRSGHVTVLDITRIDLSTGKKEVTLAVNRNESLSFIAYIRPNDTHCRLNETRVLLSSGDCAFASNANRSNYALRHVQLVIEKACRLPRGENKYDNNSETVALTITPDNPECSPTIEFPSYSARLIVSDIQKDTSNASSMSDIRYRPMIVGLLIAAVIH